MPTGATCIARKRINPSHPIPVTAPSRISVGNRIRIQMQCTRQQGRCQTFFMLGFFRLTPVYFRMPSVVFSDSGAVLYGSIRPSIQAGGGEDAKVFDNYSRWGIKGSAEASEGLTVNYQFEQGIWTTDATLYARRANAGLSGGFGTITIGKITSASYNHIGAILDQSQFYGSPETEGAPNSALSYAYSSGAVSFQVDMVSDGATDSGGGVDKTDFGLTVGLGEIGKVAFAHTNQKNKMTMSAVTYWADHDNDATNLLAPAEMIQVKAAKSDTVDNDGEVLDSDGVNSVVYDQEKGTYATSTTCSDTATDNTECVMVDAYLWTNVASSNGNITTTKGYAASATKKGGESMVAKGDEGHKASHVAVEFNVGGLTTWVGHKRMKTNGAAKKAKTTHFGVRGALGDTGMSFVAIARNKKDAMGVKTSPWSIGMSRSLGGGAILRFEHANDDNDKSGKTGVGLQVNF